MMEPALSWIPLVLLIASSLTLLISQNWRWSIIALAVLYLGMFWMITWQWSLGLAAVKLVTGWMAGAVLGVSQPGNALEETGFPRLPGRGFKVVTASLIWVLAFAIAPSLQKFFPSETNYVLGAIILIGMGLLQLGMSHRPLRVILGLFTVLSGFELLYAAVENSVLVAGLISGVNLGLALAGAYLLVNPEEEETP
ncbi:MAG TPA: hypothetical protein VN452_04905 [Longilinea sp.]|nr:hypothetical protein [Longilinea sp.]